MRHTISVLVDNKPGVLARVAGLFSGRGFNIDSLCVAETIDPLISRITVVTKATESGIEQIEKQLNKLINVIKLRKVSGPKSVQREMALIYVMAKNGQRSEILRIVDIFRGKIIDVGQEHFIIEVTGNEEKISAIINLLKPMGIKKLAKTGTVALFR